METICVLLLYFFLFNLLGFFMMRNDKRRAKKQAWRIPEVNFFMVALLGGSLGLTIGMYIFHHKTRHWYFRYGLPLILLFQLILIFILKKSGLTFIFM